MQAQHAASSTLQSSAPGGATPSVDLRSRHAASHACRKPWFMLARSNGAARCPSRKGLRVQARPGDPPRADSCENGQGRGYVYISIDVPVPNIPRLFRTASEAGHTVRSQHQVTASAGQRRGDVEIKSYLQDAGREPEPGLRLIHHTRQDRKQLPRAAERFAIASSGPRRPLASRCAAQSK